MDVERTRASRTVGPIALRVGTAALAIACGTDAGNEPGGPASGSATGGTPGAGGELPGVSAGGIAGYPGAVSGGTSSTGGSDPGAAGTTPGTGGFLAGGRPSVGAGGIASSAGGASSGAGGVGSGGASSVPVDCEPIDSQWDLCDMGTDFCDAVFRDSSGCTAVCAAAGLTCAGVWEDVEGQCAADMDRPMLSCDPPSGHQSDYCRCTGDGASQGAGGASGAGGAPGSGGTPGSGGSGGDPEPCASVTDYGVVNETIRVNSGQVYDGMCQRFVAGSALGDGSQAEDQQPVFRLEDGARLINVVLGAPAADGIHTYGDVTLANIVWEDIGEDALTIKASGTVILRGGSARDGSDKVFQVNAASRFEIYDFTATNAGKFIRQNGGTTFRVDVLIDGCDISEMDESIFRTDSSSSTIVMRNTRYSNIGTLFYDVNPANITTSGNTEY